MTNDKCPRCGHDLKGLIRNNGALVDHVLDLYNASQSKPLLEAAEALVKHIERSPFYDSHAELVKLKRELQKQIREVTK